MRLASKIRPSASSSSSATSSAPVVITPTLSRLRTSTRPAPAAARAASCRGASRVPAARSRSPRRRSLPRSRTNSPAERPRAMVTIAPSRASSRPSTSSVSSTGMTVSAPAGIGAPVMIRSAVPAMSVTGDARPAGMSPVTSSAIGTEVTSTARTANPSICELRKSGRSTSLRMSAAVTRPRPADSATGSLPSDSITGAISCSISRACSSTVTAGVMRSVSRRRGRSLSSFGPRGFQYRAIPGSMSRAQASMPPVRTTVSDTPASIRSRRAISARGP